MRSKLNSVALALSIAACNTGLVASHWLAPSTKRKGPSHGKGQRKANRATRWH